MYSYNNNEGGIAPFIRDLVIKLIFVIILVLLLIWLFPMPNMKPFYDRLFTENITLMKDTAKNYYTNERLPINTNDKVTMSLGEMIDKHLILNLIDKNGNTCNTSKSYVEITKLDTEYALKVYLSCGDEYDYIVEYIGCHDVCTDCNKEIVKEPLKETVVKTVTKPKTVVNPKPEEKPIVEEPKVTTTWITYNKATTSTTGDWTTTKQSTTPTTVNGITTSYSVNTRIGNEYDLEEKYTWVYAAMYIRETEIENYANKTVTFPGTRILDLDEIGVSDEAQDLSRSKLDLEVSSGSFYTSSDYTNYIRYRNERLTLKGGCQGACSLDMTSTEMRNASLTSNEFRITTNDVNYNNGNYILTTKVYIKADKDELEDIDGHYDSDLGLEVIYIPVKFKVTWNDLEYEKEYRYTTIVSYEPKEVLKGSIEEKVLLANNYYAVSSRTVTS